MNATKTEQHHEFTLVLLGVTKMTDTIADDLFEAGCDDATLSIRHGAAYLDFTRTAPSLKDALLSAICDVRKAGLDVLRVSAVELVSQADIARRIGRSRQLVGQYIGGTRGPGGFPAPAGQATPRRPLWLWGEVSAWLARHGITEARVVEEAGAVALINAVLEVRRQQQSDPEGAAAVMRSLAG